MQINLIRPDDWHCHLRDEAYLATTVTDTAQQFQRAIVMPNLKPPVTSVAMAANYRQRILSYLPPHLSFEPLMVLYLTDDTAPDTIYAAKESGIIFGCKLYPMGATTHSQAGVTDIQGLYPTLAAMSEANLPLLIHGEANDKNVDIFDREANFIEQSLAPLLTRFPDLKVVLEHITTREAVSFVSQGSANLAATITPHHLWLNRNDMLVGGIKPHYYCLPILKRREHQEALITAAISGNPKFFLGTDSAPHPKQHKETSCGCAGIYTAHAALEMYATVFEKYQALDKLEGFASRFGANFYQLPYNKTRVTLEKRSWQLPHTVKFGQDHLIPFLAGETLTWRLNSHEN